MSRSNEELYLELKEKMFDALESDDFYEIFNNSMKSGKNNFFLYQRYMNSVIDIKWVEKIEDSLVALDNIIRNPQRFIKQTEEVIPIEQVKRVSENSIKHLAQNTNLIAKIDDSGFITPSKLLNIQKEETFETYENRFIYTLLIHLQYFIDKRLKALHDARVKSEYKIEMENEFTIGNEKIAYQLSLSSTEKTEKKAEDFDINADTSQMDAMHRVERLIQIIYDFQNSQLIKSLKGVTLVKPPIMRTNVILKNPNFKKALELWQYIETYYDAGVSIELVEKEVVPSEEYINDLFASTLINYCLFNHHIKPAKKLAAKSPMLKKFKPNFVKHIIKDYLEDLQVDVDIIEKVFVDKIKRATEKRKETDKAIAKAIETALAKEAKAFEKQSIQDEKRLERARKEIKKRKKEEKERLTKLEKERLNESIQEDIIVNHIPILETVQSIVSEENIEDGVIEKERLNDDLSIKSDDINEALTKDEMTLILDEVNEECSNETKNNQKNKPMIIPLYNKNKKGEFEEENEDQIVILEDEVEEEISEVIDESVIDELIDEIPLEYNSNIKQIVVSQKKYNKHKRGLSYKIIDDKKDLDVEKTNEPQKEDVVVACKKLWKKKNKN